jgi:hypothetical protein
MPRQADELLQAGRLRVRFTWRGDRYAHEICLLRGGAWECVLKSVEGTPDEAWPASPPFQSLHVAPRGEGRQVALLVGMAGKSHWSASVELDAAREQARFEVACRVPAAVQGGPQSCYEIPSADIDDLITFEHGSMLIHDAYDDARVGARIELDPQLAHGRLWRPDPTTIAIAPAFAAADTAQTVCWAYLAMAIADESPRADESPGRAGG